MEQLTLGTTLKRLRGASGLSQKELAQLLEVDPSYVSHLESDRREPSVRLLRQLATHLDIPPGLLLAITLWSDMPDADRAAYQGMVESLVSLATAAQLKLPFGRGLPTK